MKHIRKLITVVVPCHNESPNIETFYASISEVVGKDVEHDYELLYVNDGSRDDTLRKLTVLAEKDDTVRIVSLSKNFGKEIATTAGLQYAHGDAIVIIDADGQHPVELIPQFIEKWEQGAKVVAGLRTGRRASLWKRTGSKLFYSVLRRTTGVGLNPATTDFRLIDKSVQAEFNRMTERNRITRGLIDWLGYKQEYVGYKENPRLAGASPQSFRKLFKLSIDSAISLSSSPLYLVAYIGAIVLPIATVLGLGMAINFLLRDPLHLHATGGAYLIVLILWLIGILLVSQGIIGLYLSHIYTETQNRPLFIVDQQHSRNI